MEKKCAFVIQFEIFSNFRYCDCVNSVRKLFNNRFIEQSSFWEKQRKSLYNKRFSNNYFFTMAVLAINLQRICKNMVYEFIIFTEQEVAAEEQKKKWHSELIFITTSVFTAHFFIWLQQIILKAEKNQGLQKEEKNFIL